MLGTRFLLHMAAWPLALALIAGCATTKLDIEAIPSSANPSEEIGQFAKDLEVARQAGVDTLSRTWFNRAEDSLANASGNLDRGGDISKILGGVAQGKAELAKARETAKLNETALPQVIKARSDAVAVGASQSKEEFAEAEENFLKLTEAIEDGNLHWAKREEPKVVAEFRNLELSAIKKNALGEIHKLVAQAEADGAKKVTPKTLARTEKTLAETDAYITKNRYDQEGIQTRAKAARFEANRLVQVTKQTNKLRSMEPEDVTLWTEGLVTEVNTTLGGPDRRDQSLTAQVAGINGAIDAVQGDRRQLQETLAGVKADANARIAELKAQSETQKNEIQSQSQSRQAELEARTQAEVAAREAEIHKIQKQLAALEGQTQADQQVRARLEAERRVNELYEQVRRSFDEDEAEVYKQGDRLLVRLRGMQFPVGQYIITPNNYTLLSKVQAAIGAFREPIVLIEGHTDSTGSDPINLELSELRASSVREYFVANGSVVSDRIRAVGFGSKRPLATNQTTEGRAVNRRIDVVIQPGAAPPQ